MPVPFFPPIINSHNIDKKDYEIPKDEIPQFLKSIGASGPEMAWLSKGYTSGKPAVVIFFGGGLGQWGLIVGKNDLEISKSDTMSITPWAAGIYFFEQIK